MVRILLVDDNPSVRHYLRAILEQQTSWQVCGEARTGAEALHQVMEAPPDLIVLDYQMPDLNGVDVPGRFAISSQDSDPDGDLHLSKQLADAARMAGYAVLARSRISVRWSKRSRFCCTDQTYFPSIHSPP